MTCEMCGEKLDPRQKGILTEVVGWTAPRDSGGVNHLIRRSATGRYLHNACLEIDRGTQDKLFGE